MAAAGRLQVQAQGDDRLKEKVAEQLKAEPGMTAAKVLREVPDAIRYTFCLKRETMRGLLRDRGTAGKPRIRDVPEQELMDRARVQGNQHALGNRDGQRFECSSTRRKASTPSSVSLMTLTNGSATR